MKNLFKFVAFGILAFSQVEGCQKCFDSITVQYQSIDSVIDKSALGYEDLEEDYIKGMRSGLHIAFKNALKIISDHHKETHLSIREWEDLLEKTIPHKD